MNIQITDNYVMTSDAFNFVLNESSIGIRGKVKGKPTLKAIGFYSSVSSLIDGLISLKMKKSTQRTLKGFIQEHNALIDEIRNLFKVGMTGIGTMPCKECGAEKKSCKK